MNLDLKALLMGLVNVVVEEAEKNEEFKKNLEYVLFSSMGIETEADPLVERYKQVEEEIFKKELGKKTKDILKEEARKRGLKVTSRLSKSDFIQLLLDFCKQAAQPQEKPQEANREEAGEQPPVTTQEDQEEVGTGPQKQEQESPQKQESKATTSQEDPQGQTTTQTATEAEAQQASQEEEGEPSTIKPPLSEIDPIVIYAQEGPERLKEILEALDLQELRALIKTHGMDPHRITTSWKKLERLREHILANAEARATKGDAFRYHQG